MHLSSRTDIEAPIAQVYAVLTDFEGWERSAMRRGAEVTRLDRLRAVGAGKTWQVKFDLKGKPREFTLKLTEVEPLARLAFVGQSTMVGLDGAVEIVSLAPNRTRLVLHLDAKPQTLGARLILQSMRLAKGKIQHKMNSRLAQFAADVERRSGTTRKA